MKEKADDRTSFDLKVENEILRNRLCGVRQEMQQLVDRIDVSEDCNLRPIRYVTELMSVLDSFFELRGVPVESMGTLNHVGDAFTLHVRLKGL